MEWTRRRVVLLLAFGIPAVVLVGLLAYVVIVGPPEALRGVSSVGRSTPTASWDGPSRPPAQCPAREGVGPELFDLGLARDPLTLDAKEHGREVVEIGRQRIALREVSFVSYEMQDCELSEIRIHGWLAMPVGAERNRSGRLAGVVRLHGLLPHQERRDALELAAGLDAAVLAIYGPGLGKSEGWDSRPDHLFDTTTDPRRSWYWSQTVALMRALTFFESRPEVDPNRLGVVGYSTGGMAGLMAAGMDPRIRAVVSWSGTAFLDDAARATPTPGWEVALLEGMNPPRTPDSAEWQRYLETLEPRNFLDTVKAPVFLINGAQDQYFPVDATVKTFEALLEGSTEHRLFLVTGYDHGPIADKVIHQVRNKIFDDVIYWFSHHLELQSSFRERVPVPKIMEILPTECCPAGGCRVCTRVQVELPASMQYEVAKVQIQLSTDRARSFYSRPGKQEGARTYVVTLEQLSPDELGGALYWAEAVYRPLGQVRRIRVSSLPHVPEGFVPRIWPDARLR